MISRNSVQNGISLFFIAIPVVFFYYVYEIYTFNFPFDDDFYAITNFLTHYSNSASILDKIEQFFYTEREHINILVRSITLIEYSSLGYLDFKILGIVGNLFLLPILYLLYLHMPKKNGYNGLLLFIPVAFILTSGSYWANSTRGLTAIQHFGVLLFTLLAMHFFTKKKLLIPFICCVCATYSFGNGIVSFFVIMVMLFLDKEYKKLLLFGTGAFLVIGIMLYQIYPLYEVKKTNVPLYVKIRFFINIFASHLGRKYLYSTFFVGISCLATACYLLVRKGYYKIDKFHAGLLVFIIVTIFFISIRRSYMGLYGSFISRYTMYSLLLLILIYYMLLKQDLINKKTGAIVFAVALFVNINSWYQNIPRMNGRQGSLVYDFHQWNTSCDLIEDEKEHTRCFIYKKFIEDGFYIPPQKMDKSRFITW